MENGPSAGWAAYQLIAGGINGGHVHLGHGLMAPQAHCRRLPAIEAQGGQAVARGHGFGQGLIERHVGWARTRLGIHHQPP